MTRHGALPADVRAELPVRGRAGIGHDPLFPTLVGTGTATAEQACRSRPSAHMLRLVAQVTEYLTARGAEHVDVVCDQRGRGLPGALTVRWYKGVSPAMVATEFAVSMTADGTALLPSWLSLRADDDFDLRWQARF